jgi:prepilin-type processing-associated H-X9-DG protein
MTVSPPQVADGLSNTVAFSERVKGSGGSVLDPRRDVYTRRGIANTADQILMACRLSARQGVRDGYTISGDYWFWAGRERTLYNHAQTPNGSVPDCSYGGITPAIDMATARSFHQGGVHVLMCDGSVRFASNGVSLAAWRALGTRNGGD